MKRRGITLVELIIIVAIIGVIGAVIFRGCAFGALFGGGESERAGLISNPLAKSTATISVLAAYSMGGEMANTYRVFAQVHESSDGYTGEETFEINDSLLDGNFSTADLFGYIKSIEKTDTRAVVECRGERSGVRSSFRSITVIHR